MDYDTFSPEGGTPHFLAQAIVANAQNAGTRMALLPRQAEPLLAD